jgi:hypothetical protein
LLRDGRTVQLHFSGALSETNTYLLTINGIRDVSVAANLMAVNSMMTFKSSLVQPGFVRREFYGGIPGANVSDLTNHAAFLSTPTVVSLLTRVETPADYGDAYGQRISGYLIPPETGNYSFYICSDDQSQFWLSSNENPAGALMICRETSYNGPRAWTGDRAGGTRTNPPAGGGIPYNIGTNISLTAGQRYYFSVLHKEATGGDNLGLTWQLPSQAVPPADGTASALTGSVVASVSPCPTITFLQQPQSQTKVESRTAT